jgi:S-adenosylmethionine:tRNA ribosyltransferase-isomerase
VLTKEFEYHLPEELIAQTPVEPRDSSRLLVIDRITGTVCDRHFSDVKDYFHPGDVLVLNNTKVIPARLPARRSGGGKAEIFLLKDLGDNAWEALVKPGSRIPVGSSLTIGNSITVRVVSIVDGGGRIIRFNNSDEVSMVLKDVGQVPLPPYIKNPLLDPSRYQTIYASVEGSVAAPTAALHFTPELLDTLKQIGVLIGFTTLHMGLGSFRPIKSENLETHVMPEEFLHVPQDVVDLVNSAKRDGRRVVACGTDVVRTLESASVEYGLIEPFHGKTELFITPGYQFKIVDMFITNLHLPRSSHLVLVSAFAGIELIRKAYNYAVKEKFRFYTFGDATLIL